MGQGLTGSSQLFGRCQVNLTTLMGTLKLVGVGRAVLQATPRHVSIPWPRDGYADDA